MGVASKRAGKRDASGRGAGEYVVLPVGEVLEDPDNENVHPELQLVMLTASVRLFGQQRSIIIDRGKVCLAGNGILQAVRRAGLPTVKCRYTELAGAMAAGYRMGDNLVARLRVMDEAIMGANLRLIAGELPTLDPAALGFDDEAFARAIDPERWSGKELSLDGVGEYSIDDETFVVKVAGVRAEDAERLLERVSAELEGTDYAAALH